MIITLLHPSRGRAEKAKQTFDYWLENSSRKIQIQHIISVDNDDDQMKLYFETFKESVVISHNNKSVVDATNNAVKISEGDILIYLSDDFKCPQNWDLQLENKFKDVESPMLLKVDDCLQAFNVDVLTIPIMNRKLYERLGYFWNPLYKSMFVDQDLYWVCKNNNWIVDAEELKFEHEHYSVGKAPRDETYTRSDANWNEGKAIYAQRKQLNFPI